MQDVSITKALIKSSKNTATEYIQNIINHLSKVGGGTINIEGGVYYINSLVLHSNLTINFKSGVKIYFNPNIKQHPLISTRWEGTTRTVHRACIYGNNIKNIHLTGEGIIDGNGKEWWEAFHSKTLNYPRPYLCSIENSQHIKIDGLTFKNSPAWTIHPFNCQDINIENISINNPKNSPNTDGINPESCQNMRITNCFFDVGDDCIAIKSGTETEEKNISCNNIVISNCNMLHGHGGVVLGSEMSGGINNIAITNCTFQNTDRGIRIKTRRGRGGLISNIAVSNITMSDVLCPLVINSYYYCGPKGSEKYVWTKKKLSVDQRTPIIKNIIFNNIIATNIRSCAAFIYGLPEMLIDQLSIQNSIFTLDQNHAPIEPAMIANAPKFNQKGIFIENTQNCTLSFVSINHADSLFANSTNNNNLISKNNNLID